MALDIELYRRTVYITTGSKGRILRRLSVIDIEPEGATHTLVFVHGYGGDAAQWIYQLRFFAQSLRVVALDLRGHGLSDDPRSSTSEDYSMNGLVDDLEAVLDALMVRQPFTLIAHSFGGAISTEYALRHPDALSGLVLIGVPSRFRLKPYLHTLIMRVPDPFFSTLAKIWGVALFARQRTLKPMLERVMEPWSGAERLARLRVPTLVVLGYRDTVFLREYYEDVSRSIPGAQRVEISVSAHLVQLERPDAVNRALRRFIVASGAVERAVVGGEGTLIGGVSRSTSSVAGTSHRHFDMPWLQHYDDAVPEQLPLPKQLLHELLSNNAIAHPQHAALIFFGQSIGYRELDRQSNRFAHALRGLGVEKDDRVAIVLPNIPQCVIAFYGALKAGAVVVLGSPLSSMDEMRYQLRDSGARVLLTLASYRTEAKHICLDTSIQHLIYTDVREYLPLQQRLQLAQLLESKPAAQSRQQETDPNNQHPTLTSSLREHAFQKLLRRQISDPLVSGVQNDDLALIQYTSGTTDTPKGVMLSHCNLVMNLAQVVHWIPETKRAREVVLGVLPLSHSYGITSAMNAAMGLAATLVLLPTNRVEEMMEAIKRYHPSIFPGIPDFYLAIANYPRVRSYGVSSIRVCVSGSAPLAIEVQEAFEKLTRGHLVEGYGLTEAAPVTHSNPLKGERRVGSIGLPLPGTHARIVDVQTGKLLPPGEVGELLVSGPQVMQGYWNMPEETAQVLLGGWLRTGDLARMDEDGFFSIVDRKKDMILAGAYNVYPRDVEEVLYEHPKVLEAAVVNTGGRTAPIIKAFVVLKRGEQLTADELLALCRERLDAYEVPAQIEFRSQLPKNMVGKVLRRLLVEA